jgi:hypothetical protein
MNRVERVIAFLEKMGRGVYVDGEALRGPGGRHAWRTAVSECRPILKPRGLTVHNRQRWVKVGEGGFIVSEYAIVALPQDETPILRGHDVNVWGLR